MKRLFHLLAVVSVVGVMALLSGCEKENLGGKRAFKEVIFGAKAHSSADTRTQYMDYDGTAAYQNIRWLASDKIRIYSPDAARRVAVEAGENPSNYYYWADYQVVPNSSDPTTGTLKNMNTDGNSASPQNPGYNPGTTAEDSSSVSNGLVWLNGESATFYGAYPSKALRGNKDGSGPSVADGKFNFAIPNVQPFSVKGNMDYAFMTAKTYAKDGQNVTLNFFPDFTAFEISLKCEESGSDVKLKSFKLGTTANGSSGNLAGSYTVDLSGTKSYTLPVDASSYGKSITVNTSSDPKSIPSGNADPLVFTVFALPDNLSNLYVEFTTSSDGEDNRTWKLDLSKKDANNVFQPITFGACKKHRIYGLVLPSGELLISVDTAPWLAGGIHTFTTIEDVTTFFLSYKRWNAENNYSGAASWNLDNYVAIAPGRSETERVDPDDPNSDLTNLPLYSTMITMTTVSVGVPLRLISDNPKVGFVVPDAQGVYSTTPSRTLDIRASTSITDVVTTSYFVVPVDDSAIGEVAHISLVRTDSNTPIAFSHSDMPGTTDHSKVPYKVLSVSDYTSTTHDEVPSK